MKIILFRPQIPQNTGNIVRTCAVFNAGLVLVRPLGFSTSSRMLKRAGLDYWNDVSIEEIDNLETYLEKQNVPFYFFSSKAEKNFSEVSFSEDSLLIFGNEQEGLAPIFRKRWPSQFVKIPMKESSRCLNLSNSVAIASYELIRQNPQNLSTARNKLNATLTNAAEATGK